MKETQMTFPSTVRQNLQKKKGEAQKAAQLLLTGWMESVIDKIAEHKDVKVVVTDEYDDGAKSWRIQCGYKHMPDFRVKWQKSTAYYLVYLDQFVESGDETKTLTNKACLRIDTVSSAHSLQDMFEFLYKNRAGARK